MPPKTMQARGREPVSPFLAPLPPPLPFQLSLRPPTTGIDVNQTPPQELDPPPFFAPPPCESCSPPLPWPVAVKRERGKTPESSSRASEEEDAGRKKLRLSKEQSALLEESFQEQSTLNPKQKKALAKKLSLTPRQVEVWFQNRRARTKLKQTEFDCEYLKRCCDSLTQENRRLQKEVQELRAIKVAPPCVIGKNYYAHVPAASLTMCPSCQRVATMENLSVGLPRQRQPSAAC